MRAAILALLALILWFPGFTQAAAQYVGDKKQDPTGKKEPEKITADTLINGRNLDQWITLISGSDRSMTELAVDSIYQYGPELALKAVPAMIAELNKHKPAYQIDLSVRVNIPPRLSMILSSLPNPDSRLVADAVAALRRMLDDPQIVVKFRVAQSLAQMGPLARDARPELIRVLKEDRVTWELRHAAVLALGAANYDPNPNAVPHQPTLDAMFYALTGDQAYKGDPAYKVRLAALQALELMRVGQFPTLKSGYQTRLQKIATDDTSAVCRLRAHLALYPLLSSPTDKAKRLEIIGKFLEHSDPTLRMDAAQALGELGENARPQLPRLLNGLLDKDQDVKRWSAWALGCVRDQAALPQLKQIVSDANAPQELRETAQNAINAINGVSAPKKDEIKKRY